MHPPLIWSEGAAKGSCDRRGAASMERSPRESQGISGPGHVPAGLAADLLVLSAKTMPSYIQAPLPGRRVEKLDGIRPEVIISYDPPKKGTVCRPWGHEQDVVP